MAEILTCKEVETSRPPYRSECWLSNDEAERALVTIEEAVKLLERISKNGPLISISLAVDTHAFLARYNRTGEKK